MSEGGYKIRKQDAMHFITFAVVDWVDVFTRRCYSDIIIESLKHCQLKKKLQLHAWCIMSNHLHLIASALNKNLSDILRDFKKFTSVEIIKSILQHPGESRKEWMIEIFKKNGACNSRNKEYQFWQQDNHPKELFSVPFTLQKLNYIHNNPVAAGIVVNPWEYVYSSALDYHLGRQCGLLNLDIIRTNHPIHHHSAHSNIQPYWPGDSCELAVSKPVAGHAAICSKQNEWKY